MNKDKDTDKTHGMKRPASASSFPVNSLKSRSWYDEVQGHFIKEWKKTYQDWWWDPKEKKFQKVQWTCKRVKSVDGGYFQEVWSHAPALDP